MLIVHVNGIGVKPTKDYNLTSVLSGSQTTTSETKSGFLLIEPLMSLCNTQKQWPPGFDPWWPFLNCRGCKNLAFQPIWAQQNNVTRFIGARGTSFEPFPPSLEIEVPTRLRTTFRRLPGLMTRLRTVLATGSLDRWSG